LTDGEPLPAFEEEKSEENPVVVHAEEPLIKNRLDG